jgi:hypothetical protein
VRGGEQGGHRSALERSDDGGTLELDRAHDGQHVVHLLLEGGGADHRVRQAGAPPVEHRDCGELPEPLRPR